MKTLVKILAISTLVHWQISTLLYATAPPTANFSAFSIVISTGDSIDFTDLSDTGTAAITTWSWTFSGGTPGASTDTNPPNIKYTAAGKYDVKLFVRSADGEDSLTKVDYICVGVPCVDFTASQTIICGDETIDFTDLSGNTPTSWAWTFAGGTPGTSTAQNPTITYNSAGTYDVTLIANNSDGSDTLMKASYITANSCTKFTVTDTLDAGAGSLRQAILDANVNVGLDTIVFNISGAGPHTISITSAELPELTDNQGAIIDGYTQSGAVENTSVSGALNGTLDIVVSNTTDTLITGLTLTSNNNVIKGLVLPDWGDSANTNGRVIEITGNNNKVLGCYISMDYTGTTVGSDSNTNRSIHVTGSNNTIGDGTAAGRNLISGSGGDVILGVGIVLASGTTNNTVKGNIIGLQYDGTTPVASSNQYVGIQVTGSSHVIGGNTAGERNIISGNIGWGIWILGAATTVTGNYIGLAVDGITAITGNKFGGVALESGANGNTIGGSGAGEGNVISGNRDGGNGVGVRLRSVGTTGNIIIGNIIGLAADGSSNITGANQFNGVLLWDGANGNTIGGTGAGEGNVISGNASSGVQIRGDAGSNNTVVGNIIGPQQDGNTAPTTTQSTGIQIGGIGSGTSNNTIGGNSAGARNIISANSTYGIYITSSGGSGNIVKGNYIGLASTGTSIITGASQDYGIHIDGSDNNTIGGNTAGARNVISGNLTYGIYLTGASASNNGIKGNYIGSGAGLSPISGAAQDYGVYLASDASNNTIGGWAAGEGNTIAFNTANGIFITGAGSDSNLIARNLIYDTTVAMTGKPINLNSSGNANYTPPGIDSANQTNVWGSSANNGDTVEVYLHYDVVGGFKTTTAGKNVLQYLGSTVVAAGNWMLGGLLLNAGDEVIANVRNNATKNTSEFSVNVNVAVPIELLYFDAMPVNNQFVLAKWATQTELNTDYFIVERSQDAINYQRVGSVEAAGNSYMTLSYSLLDEAPWLGTSYYRLKQVDIGGNYEYYGPVAVRLEGIEIININPNPARNEITYGIVSWKDTEVKVNIYDVLGRKLIAQKASIKKGFNQLTMDVSHLSSAIYILKITTETDNHYTQKEFVVN